MPAMAVPETGVCVQKDDFMDILCLAHEADAIIAEAPIYYNCMAAQMMTVINRLCCTFACKTYHVGPKKRVGMFLTCTGSEPEEMKRHVKNILTLPSVSRAISQYRTEVFTQCVSDSICHDRPDYLERARKIVRWQWRLKKKRYFIDNAQGKSVRKKIKRSKNHTTKKCKANYHMIVGLLRVTTI